MAETFEEFVTRASPALLRTATALTGDRALADDLVNASLARVWPHWGRVCDGYPEAYTRTVMTRLQASWWQRRWRGEVPTGELPDVAAAETDVAQRDRLRWALSHLPLAWRQAVVLRYVDDLPVAEVARVLGRSEGTVKSQCSRGLAQLRGLLGQEGDDDE